jgi:hypothetical protein
VERRHLACVASAALLLVCWITQSILFAAAEPDMLSLALGEAAASIDVENPSPALRLAVFAPAGEESGEVEKALRKRFEGNDAWKLLDRDQMDETVREFGAAVNPRPAGRDEALVSGRKLGVEAALWTNVAAFRRSEERMEAAFEWGVVRIPNGDAMGGGKASVAKSTGFFTLDRYRARVDQTSALFRAFLWIVTLLLAPVALLPLNELLLGMRQNAAAGALLGFYALLQFALMLCLNGFRLLSVFWGIAGVVALAVAAGYTLAALNASVENDM